MMCCPKWPWWMWAQFVLLLIQGILLTLMWIAILSPHK